MRSAMTWKKDDSHSRQVHLRKNNDDENYTMKFYFNLVFFLLFNFTDQFDFLLIFFLN